MNNYHSSQRHFRACGTTIWNDFSKKISNDQKVAKKEKKNQRKNLSSDMSVNNQDTSNLNVLNLKKEALRGKILRGKKKVLMATWDDYDESSNEDEEQANMTLMANVQCDSNSESVEEEIEVLFDFSCNKLIIMLNEILNKNHNISAKLKNLIKDHSILIDKYKTLEKYFKTYKGKIRLWRIIFQNP